MNDVSSARIEIRNKNGCQSLRLTIESPEMVRLILRNRRELNRRSKVFLEADLTSKQRAEVNMLKFELKESLFLRYIKGIPKLITKSRTTSILLVNFQNVRGLRTKLQLLLRMSLNHHTRIF